MKVTKTSIKQMFEKQHKADIAAGLYISQYFYIAHTKDSLGGMKCEVLKVNSYDIDILCHKYKFCWIEPHMSLPFFSNIYKNSNDKVNDMKDKIAKNTTIPTCVLREKITNNQIKYHEYNIDERDATDLVKERQSLGTDVAVYMLQNQVIQQSIGAPCGISTPTF